MSTYSVINFLDHPNVDDIKLRIRDKSGNLIYIIDPNISYVFSKSNLTIIKVEDRSDIQLDFESSSEAIDALYKLNQYKKYIIEK